MKLGRPRKGDLAPSSCMRDEIIALWRAGHSLTITAEKIGCVDRTISRVLENAGLTGGYRKPRYRRHQSRMRLRPEEVPFQ